MQPIVDFFSLPFFIIASGVSVLIVFLGLLYSAYIVLTGILPVWIRLGKGLSRREIAVFADTRFDGIKSLLMDSQIFKEKNIQKIGHDEIKKAKKYSLMLMHWQNFKSDLDKILDVKNDADALIVYAPVEEESLSSEEMQRINDERNTTLVRFRGRLLNDIVTAMITTAYKK